MMKRTCPLCSMVMYSADAEAKFWDCLKCDYPVGQYMQEPAEKVIASLSDIKLYFEGA